MIFFFYGDNSYELAVAVRRIRAQYEKKTETGLDYLQFDMQEDNLSSLLNALAAVPMFASSRLIVVRGLSQNKAAAERIGEILTIIPDSTVVIFIDLEIDRRSSYFKHMAALPNAREFVPLDPGKMRDWILRETKKRGGEIDALTAQKLYETAAHEYRPRDKMSMKLSGSDQWRLLEEIKKLVSFDPHITHETIGELVIVNVEQTIFDLVEAVASGNTKSALEYYQNLIEHGAADQQIIAMLNWQFRAITLAITESVSPSLSAQIGISPYVLNKAARLGDSFDQNLLRRAYRLMVEADLAIKTGEKPSNLAVEELIFALCDRD